MEWGAFTPQVAMDFRANFDDLNFIGIYIFLTVKDFSNQDINNVDKKRSEERGEETPPQTRS